MTCNCSRTCFTLLCVRVSPQCISSLMARSESNCDDMLRHLQVKDSSQEVCGLSFLTLLPFFCSPSVPLQSY